MDINQLKFGFASYLRTLKGDEEIKYDPTSDISIFQYAKEFKQYIKNRYSSDEINLTSMSIGDILDLEVVNGKLVDPDKLAQEEQENNQETPIEGENAEEETPIEGENTNEETNSDKVPLDDSSLTDILNTLMEDELFSNAIDTDQNGEFSNEELSNFFNAISIYDGDGTNVSLDDILTAAESIVNNEFPSIKTFYDEENEATIESSANISNTPTPAQMASARGGGAAPVEEKTIANMTLPELQTELSTAQSDVSDKQTALNNIILGNTPELQELQKNIDLNYQIYKETLEAVDKDMAKQVDDKEKEINNKDVEIANQETTVSNCENNYNNAVSTRENLETTKAALESSLSSASDEERSSIQNQINQLQTQINQAEKDELDAKNAGDEAKEKLTNLKKERDELQSGENGLDDLNSQMSELEADIIEQYPQVQEAMTNYKNAKETYNETKVDAANKARNALIEQQNYVNDIKTAINKKENKSEVKEYFTNAMGEDVIEFASQFIGCNEADGSADKFLASWTTSAKTPWCAAFVQYIYEHSAADSLPEWYSSISNKWSCGNLYRAAKAADAQINVNDAQTGDMVLFDWDLNGGKDHVGIIVSIEDGVVTTIEGNTSDQVAYRTYKVDNPKLSFFKMT